MSILMVKGNTETRINEELINEYEKKGYKVVIEDKNKINSKEKNKTSSKK